MTQGVVLAFLRRAPKAVDWTQQELAEFYRVEGALLQAGLSVGTDRGVSDEGDPWFVFCRADNEEVIAHFARIDGEYVVVSNIYSGAARGRDFRLLVRQMLDMHPLKAPMRRSPGQKVYLHPAALLTALLASAYLLSSEKDLSGDHASPDADGRGGALSWLARQKFSISTVVALAIAWLDHQTDVVSKLWEHVPLLPTYSDEKATHVASVAHDGPALDVLQAVRASEASAHRIDLSKQAPDLSGAHDQDGHAHVVPTVNPTTNVAQVVADKTPDANGANVEETSALNVSAGPGHLDLAQGPDAAPTAVSPPHAIIPVKGVIVDSSDAASKAGATETHSSSDEANSSSGVVMSEAYQAVASDLGIASIQPIVLSNAPSLNAALQQVFTQLGFAPDVLHDGASVSASAVTGTPTTAITTQPVVPVTTSPVPADDGATLVSPQNEAQFSQDLDVLMQKSPLTMVSPQNDAQFVQEKNAFMQSNANLQIFFFSGGVIYADTNPSDTKSPDYGSHAFEWSNDGSVVMLVGIQTHHSSGAVA
jgi:hypothetical protein